MIPWIALNEFNGYSSASAVTMAIEAVNRDPNLNYGGKINLRCRGEGLGDGGGDCNGGDGGGGDDGGDGGDGDGDDDGQWRWWG